MSIRPPRILIGIALAGLLLGRAQAAPETSTKSVFDGGGDIRLRYESFDKIPVAFDPPGVARGGENDYFRFRTRLWGSADVGGVRAYARLLNEFRHVLEPDNSTAWVWPDEAIVDQLYLESNGLFDGALDFRLGRQDLRYGQGRIIVDGTPKDGSRTFYCDALKLVLHPADKTTVDLLAIYNQPEAGLEIGNLDRDLTGFDKSANDLTESGGGVYATFNAWEHLPFELYYFFKDESAWETLTNGVSVARAGRRTHTVGARALPRLNSQLGFEFEAAVQRGETDDDIDLSGYLLYAGATWNVPRTLHDAKPYLTAACYLLSGDDPGTTGKNEGWNPIWSRATQVSELYSYSFDAEKFFAWSNLLYPHVEAGLDIAKGHKFFVVAGLLLAPEENGSGGGNERGMLYRVRYDFPLASGLVFNKDSLFGHLTAEVLDPGDYHTSDDTAFFARAEISYKF